MTLVDFYKPELWHDFFVMVGGAAAALTGLVFVALSINLKTIANDATHRYRAIGTLTGFIAVFTICALGLMPNQTYQVIGVEWLIVSLIAGFIYIHGYIQAKLTGKSTVGLRTNRLLFGTGLYIAIIISALLILVGNTLGPYIAATFLIIFVIYTTTGAWLLLMGVDQK